MKIYLDSSNLEDLKLIELLFTAQVREKTESLKKTLSETLEEIEPTQPTHTPEKTSEKAPTVQEEERETPQTVSHPEPTITLEQLQDLVRKIGGSNKARLVEIKEWLVTKGVSKLSELPEKDYQEAYDYLKTLEG